MSTRTGKIARLPREVRDKLNRRLYDGEPGKALVKWLNALPEVEAVLEAEFAGRPVREQNLSEWKQGGYREWLAQQDALEMVRRLSADADELKQATAEPLGDKLAVWVAARYVVAAKSLSGRQQAGEGADWPRLREFCNDVVALRRGDHYAERLQIERERLEFEQNQAKKKTDEEFWEWASDPEIRDKISQAFRTRAEEIQPIREEVLGCAPDSGWTEDAEAPSATVEGERPPDESVAQSDQIKPNQTSSENP